MIEREICAKIWPKFYYKDGVEEVILLVRCSFPTVYELK